MADIVGRTVCEHARALEKREYSSEELVRAYADIIEEKNKTIKAYISVTAERAIELARESDKRRAEGRARGALDGIPYAVKDNICTRGVRTTCGSKMLENYIPPYDATVIERLSAAGAVMLGKTNMDEFGMGSSGENSFFGATLNPRGGDRVAGGSSSGSAAAVGANMAAFALGSDTGGSIRQPSSFCGVVGMKPTYGRVSRYGLTAFASSLDQIGVISGTVRDNALILNAISGYDSRDLTSSDKMCDDLMSGLGESVAGLRIGVPIELFGEDISEDVRSCVRAALRKYSLAGARITEISLPSLYHTLSAYYIISSAEASSNLARFDGVRYGHRAEVFENIGQMYERSRSEGFGKEVKRRIMLGTFVLSEGYRDEYYKRALAVRADTRAELESAFEMCDVIMTPTAPTVAYRLGEKIKDPIAMYMGDVCSVPANIAGVPAISVPCGTGEGGMPVGLQIIGKAFDEATVYRAAGIFD